MNLNQKQLAELREIQAEIVRRRLLGEVERFVREHVSHEDSAGGVPAVDVPAADDGCH